jgi:hypothetical protein
MPYGPATPFVFRTPSLRKYQEQTLFGLQRGLHWTKPRTFTVMYPRQAGKNEVSALLVASLLAGHMNVGGSVVVCAPTLYPQGMISFDRTLRLLGGRGPHAANPEVRVEGSTIHCGAASAVFLSASPAAHVAGHTASLALIGDEAQEIDAEWFNRQFRPMAASTGAPTFLFGTAWDGHTMLEVEAARNLEIDARTPREFTNGRFHHQVSWQEVASSNPRYGAYVRAERERLGANHPLFLTQYELRPAEGAGGLLSPAQLAALRGEHARLRQPRPGERYVAGLDFGGAGPDADATVLTIGRLAGARVEVVQHVSWQGTPFAMLVPALNECFAQWRPELVVADATGMGAPLIAQLTTPRPGRIESFVFSAVSKSELGYELLAAADTRRLALYADDGSAESAACFRELRDCRGGLRGHGQLGWSARPGAHDDYVASLALCLRAGSTLPERRVARGWVRE